MGVLFAFLLIFTFGFAFNSVQSNTICAAFEEAFNIPPSLMGVILTSLTLIIIFGGIQRIAKVSSIIVPVMALGYIFLSLFIVIVNAKHLPEVIELIIANAFGWEQALSGGIGMALMQGIKRGLFSNEAGMARTQCSGKCRCYPSCKTRINSDIGSFYRYTCHMYLHCFHHSFQRSSLHKRSQWNKTYSNGTE